MAPAGSNAVLYWTGANDVPDGWDCVGGGWTCEGDTAIGIDRYEAELGLVRTPSPHTEHDEYRDPPELTGWW